MGFSGGGAGSGGSSFVPVGAIMLYGGAVASPPSGWVACLGQAISRTTFSALFGIIGTEYGVGDGSTTFNVPDFRTSQSFPRGATNDAGRGTTGGVSDVTLAIADIPSHDHERGPAGLSLANNFDPTGGVHPSNPVILGATLQVNRAPVFTEVEGGGGSHTNEPPFVDVNYIIKV